MANPFKTDLKNRKLLVGPLLTIPSTEIAEMMAHVGFDWVWLEMEHSPISLAQAQQMIQAIAGRCACLVRAPWNDTVWIKRILDLGCDGVIIPQIKSAAEAADAVRACRYPPEGVRSVGIARAQRYGMGLQTYVDQANHSLTVVVQIEHADAVNCIDEILGVDGIDAILIGPYDLSASMGLVGQVTHPVVQATVEKVRAACRQSGMPIGVFAADVHAAVRQMEQGCSLIALSTDALFLATAAQQGLDTLRQGDVTSAR